jgi:hypothetical protein
MATTNNSQVLANYTLHALRSQIERDLRAALQPSVDAVLNAIVHDLADSLKTTLVQEHAVDLNVDLLKIVVEDRRKK